MQTPNNGMLISIEGIDGSGKSTLTRNLCNSLIKNGLATLLTKEPGDTELGKTLRSILQKSTTPITDKSEFLLFAADRAEHIERIIKPALAQKKIVVSDRMADSSVVYQGYGRGLSIPMIESINKWVMNGITPDLILYLKIDIEQAVKRLKIRNEDITRFEDNRQFTERLVKGFTNHFANKPNVIELDAHQSPEQLTAHALQKVMQWIQKTS